MAGFFKALDLDLGLVLPLTFGVLASSTSTFVATFLTFYSPVLSIYRSSLRDFSFSLRLMFMMKLAQDRGKDFNTRLMTSSYSMLKPKLFNHSV